MAMPDMDDLLDALESEESVSIPPASMNTTANRPQVNLAHRMMPQTDIDDMFLENKPVVNKVEVKPLEYIPPIEDVLDQLDAVVECTQSSSLQLEPEKAKEEVSEPTLEAGSNKTESEVIEIKPHHSNDESMAIESQSQPSSFIFPAAGPIASVSHEIEVEVQQKPQASIEHSIPETVSDCGPLRTRRRLSTEGDKFRATSANSNISGITPVSPHPDDYLTFPIDIDESNIEPVATDDSRDEERTTECGCEAELTKDLQSNVIATVVSTMESEVETLTVAVQQLTREAVLNDLTSAASVQMGPEPQETSSVPSDCVNEPTTDDVQVELPSVPAEMNEPEAADELAGAQELPRSSSPQPELPPIDTTAASTSETLGASSPAPLNEEAPPVESVSCAAASANEVISPPMDQELVQELEQMTDAQIAEGTAEAAAMVAAANFQEESREIFEPTATPEAPLSSASQTVVLSTHDLSIFNANPALTESELQLGKTKPYWIPDEDCNTCMLCVSRFTVINRRHHCRCCGRVLCSSCCNMKRTLPYIADSDKKQRVCEPCFRTLDRIEEYEARLAVIATLGSTTARSDNPNQENINPGTSEAGDVVPSAPTEAESTSTLPKCRKKSVLKSKRGEATADEPRRSVKFLDGVRPGEHDGDEAGPSSSRPSATSVTTEPDSVETEDARQKKPKRNQSRRNRERRVEEEQLSIVQDECFFLVDPEVQMTRLGPHLVLPRLLAGERLTFAVRRNFWVVAELVSGARGQAWCFSSRGMAAIGVDELVLAFDFASSDEEQLTAVSKLYEEADNASTQVSDPPPPTFITAILYLFDHFFLESLIPTTDSLDAKVGIRRCGARMAKFYRIPSGSIAGIEAVAVIFHRPLGQDFSDFSVPTNMPFLVGTFVKKAELPWAMTIPNRLLLRVGLMASYFPVPIVNARVRPDAFSDCCDNTVLKVFNDFKNWSYRLPKVLGSTVEIESGSLIKVFIPTWAVDEMREVLEGNPNMLAWATTLSDHPDCHLVAIQNPDGSFRSEIFTDIGSSRQCIGANFIVLDGSLKNSSEKFVMNILEDGIVLRFPVETMEEIYKCLNASAPFTVDADSLSVQILFVDPYEPKARVGALVSPIDGMHLLGNFQYGLTLARQFRSQLNIPNACEWALRLSSVIYVEKGKIPLMLQPRYFDICEQIGVQVANTMEKLVRPLVLSDQRSVCIRVRIEPDSVTYETAPWKDLEQEHYAWTALLDDQLIPYLYQLCPAAQTLFYMELQLAIVSVRLLQNAEY